MKHWINYKLWKLEWWYIKNQHSILKGVIAMVILSSLLLAAKLNGAVIDVHTEDYIGKLTIEKRDFVIVSPSHSLASNSAPNIVICESTECREEFIEKMQHLYRTNGISVFKIR